MPLQKKAACSLCTAQIPYYGRRDLLGLIDGWRRDLEQAFASSGRLADVTGAVAENMAQVRSNANGLCARCARPAAREVGT